MVFSSKRQAFLVDQGYAFKVITQLKDMDSMPDLAFATPEARRELLSRVLSDADSKAWKEEEKESAGLLADGNLFHGPDGKPMRKGPRPTKRTASALTDLSGEQGMSYIEQNRSAHEAIKGKKTTQHAFFRKIAREKEKRG